MYRGRTVLALFTILAAVLLAAMSSSAQEQVTEGAIRDHQNRQRVLSLVLYENRIKALEDAPMRCGARSRIAAFIYETELKDLYHYADDQVAACLRDTAEHPVDFKPDRTRTTRSSILTLMRRHSPEKAKLLEEKYPVEEIVSDAADSREIWAGGNVGPAAERAIARISAGEISPMTHSVLRALRQKDAELANRALDAFVTLYETRSVFTDSDKLLPRFGFLFAEPTVSPGIRVRYLRMSLNLARRVLNEPGNDYLYQAAAPNLRVCLPQFEKYLPESLGEAQSLLAAIESNRARLDSEKEEAFKRIAESDDKLEQILVEIGSAKDPDLKKVLIRQGAALANYEKKFRLSVDLALKYDEEGEGYSWREMHLRGLVVRAALRADDVESAEYAIDAVRDVLDRADATLRIGAHFESKRKSPDDAAAYLERALKLIESAEPSHRALYVLRQAAALSFRLPNHDIYSVVGRTVKIINALPMEDPEQMGDPEKHAAFVADNLYAPGNSAAVIFDLVCEKDPEAAYPYIQSIQRRDIRLMAEISYEKFKTHTLPNPSVMDQ